MNKEFIDFLKEKISIYDVISTRVRLRKSGKDWFGLCPFHKEKTGSFKVDADAGYYYCFGCGAHGDAITFLQEFEHISFPEAVEQLANRYGIPLPENKEHRALVDPNKQVYEALGEIKSWFAKQLHEKTGHVATEYLKARKISDKSIEEFQLGYALNNNMLQDYLKKKGFSSEVLLKTGVFNKSRYGNELINRYNSRLIFPIFDIANRCVGFGGRIIEKSDVAKYINSPETSVFTKSHHLYGYSVAKKKRASEIILTEGYLDVISMHQAGFDGAVAPLGTSISETQIGMCWKMCNTPVISLDGDIAGIKASYRWIDKILLVLQPGKSFKFAKLPQGTDPDILISEGKVDVIKEAVANAQPLSDWLWNGAFELYSSETPEQKAAIIKTLSEKISTIKDESVRKLYSKMLKQKERDLYYSKKKSDIKFENIRPVISSRKKIEKIFVVTILNHPYIIDSIWENLVSANFEDFELRELKNQIVDIYEENKDSLENYVAKIKQIREEKADLSEDVKLHAVFTNTETSDDEALKRWLELWERYSTAPSVTLDLQNAASSLKSSFSETDWQRLKALKKEAILNQRKR
ncbi:MAG: DNA primase [Alphaproteobacteria bacterium]|nr:DNA primase [Alphaproteobacteria bacterium]